MKRKKSAFKAKENKTHLQVMRGSLMFDSNADTEAESNVFATSAGITTSNMPPCFRFRFCIGFRIGFQYNQRQKDVRNKSQNSTTKPDTATNRMEWENIISSQSGKGKTDKQQTTTANNPKRGKKGNETKKRGHALFWFVPDTAGIWQRRE